jgi:hypothetical protein
MEMVNDRYLAPFLVQMAVYSAIDATERTVGSSTLALNGVFEFRDGTTPIRLNNSFSGEFSVPQQVSLATAIPLAYALQSGFDSLQLKNVKLEIESFDEKKQAQIEQVWTSRQEVRAGDAVELTVVLASPNGGEVKRKVTYEVPVGAAEGPLYFTVADGMTTNLTEIRQFVGAQPRSPSQLVSLVNSLRGNTKAYVRVWRADANYDVQGHDFPSPPPSLEQVLVQTQAAVGGGFPGRNSKVAELEIDVGGVVVTGSKLFKRTSKDEIWPAVDLACLSRARNDRARPREMGSYQIFCAASSPYFVEPRWMPDAGPENGDAILLDQPDLERGAGSGRHAIRGYGHRGWFSRSTSPARAKWSDGRPARGVWVALSGAAVRRSSPKGKIYRIEGGEGCRVLSPGSVYIWSLVFAKMTLFGGFGRRSGFSRGRSGGEIYYETGQTHVTSLALDTQGRLLAGTEPNGILYRIEAKGKAFVLYDADLPEIRAITTAPEGVIYAAAQGGASTRRGIAATQMAPGEWVSLS